MLPFLPELRLVVTPEYRSQDLEVTSVLRKKATNYLYTADSTSLHLKSLLRTQVSCSMAGRLPHAYI